ncbi:hypothetical protein DY000_02012982 [Brassica cretica]|uniref:Uncharacterized protein n=1 Tax=Brassica cretica TaxID=69181 RepID=A0ABQ7DDW6_BRACR|nr:hypothetical protein DY000_02012982 [Brassica cretica]
MRPSNQSLYRLRRNSGFLLRSYSYSLSFHWRVEPLFVRSRSSLSAEVLTASGQPERMSPMPPLS